LAFGLCHLVKKTTVTFQENYRELSRNSENSRKLQIIQENYTDLSKKSENSKNSRKLW
jgi:hypothetical protein